jgi:hypothetical protein
MLAAYTKSSYLCSRKVKNPVKKVENLTEKRYFFDLF